MCIRDRLDFVWIAVYRTARGQGIMPVAMMRACCEAPMPMMARLAMVCTPDEPVHRLRTTALHGAMRASDVLRRRPYVRPSGPRPRRRASNVGGRRSLVSPGGSQSATGGEKGQAMIVTVCM